MYNVAQFSSWFSKVYLIPPVHKCTIGMSTTLHQTQPQVATSIKHLISTKDI